MGGLSGAGHATLQRLPYIDGQVSLLVTVSYRYGDCVDFGTTTLNQCRTVNTHMKIESLVIGKARSFRQLELGRVNFVNGHDCK